jgi:NADPH:quinone reductase
VRDWQPGDRVFGLVGGGGLAELVAVHERHVARVPDGLDEQVAAAAPEACITAHDAVFVQCGLLMGETLLVHGAAGGVGSAGLQLALAGGARAIGVARSDETRALVSELGGEAIAEEGFADAVLERTRGRGADVILELVGAPHFPDNLRALASRGRIAVVGTGGGTDASLPLGALMGKRATVRGTMLRARPLEEKAAAVRAFEREVVPQLAAGRVRVPIDGVFPADQHVEAYDRLAASGKRGKVLLSF